MSNRQTDRQTLHSNYVTHRCIPCMRCGLKSKKKLKKQKTICYITVGIESTSEVLQSTEEASTVGRICEECRF